LGNYRADRQVSMKRFADLMVDSLSERGITAEALRPEAHLGRLATQKGEVAKWLGYVDKFILFPRRLRKFIARMPPQERNETVFHVCDHSNSPYVAQLTGVAHLVTCHDLMAVKLALGTLEGPPVRWTGRRLQAMIRRGLERAANIVCDSDNTRRDLNTSCEVRCANIATIRLQLNYPYGPLDGETARHRIGALVPDDGRPMLLHVGNNSWYKNRDGILRICRRLKERSGRPMPRLVIVGAPMTAAQRQYLAGNDLEHDVFWLAECSTLELEGLYNMASVFLFPSKYEGFGWPPIEAQACGCPVVASYGGALAEVLEDSALTADWSDEQGLSEQVRRILSEKALAGDLRAAGFKNVVRFRAPKMIDDYIQFYKVILEAKRT